MGPYIRDVFQVLTIKFPLAISWHAQSHIIPDGTEQLSVEPMPGYNPEVRHARLPQGSLLLLNPSLSTCRLRAVAADVLFKEEEQQQPSPVAAFKIWSSF